MLLALPNVLIVRFISRVLFLLEQLVSMECVQLKGELADCKASLSSAHAQLQMMSLQVSDLEADKVHIQHLSFYIWFDRTISSVQYFECFRC